MGAHTCMGDVQGPINSQITPVQTVKPF